MTPEEEKALKDKIELTKEATQETAAQDTLLKDIIEKHTGNNQLLQETRQRQEDITGQLLQQLKAGEGNTLELKNTLNISRQVSNAIRDSIGPYKDIATIQKQITKNEKIDLQLKQQLTTLGISEVGGMKELAEEVNKRNKYASISKSLAEEAKQQQKDELNSLHEYRQAKISGDKEAIEAAKIKNDETQDIGSRLKEQIKTHSAIEAEASKILTPQAKQAQALLDSNKNLEEANSKLAEQLEIQENIANALGLTGGVLKVINKTLGGALGNTDQILKNSEERVKLLIEERSYYDEHGKLIVGNVSKFRGFGIQLHEIGKSIVENMLDPLVLLKAVLDYSDQITTLQKGMSLTKKEAKELKKTFGEISESMGDAAINAMTIQKAAGGINSALGDFAFTFEAPDMQKMVGEAAKFQEKMGGSNEEMTGIVQSSLLTGKGFEELQLGILEVTGELENQTGIRLDEAKLMKQSASVTGEIRAQLGGSVVEISKAIAAAKSFGMELATVAKTANSLLDFEQSIGAELEAELLTGKQLNLEKARLASLTGDYKTLAEEINKNVGDFSDFSNMNVLQQRAMAKAFGMSSDEMADMLVTEENIEALKEKARITGDKKTLQMLNQRTLQEDFNDSMNMMKQIFVDIVGGPGGALLGVIASIAKGIAEMANTFGGKLVLSIVIFGGVAFKIMSTFIKMRKIMVEFKAIMGSINLLTKSTNAAERLGLISKNQAVRARTRETLLQKEGMTTEKLSNLHRNAGLGTTLRKNAANTIGLGQKTTENTLEAQGNTLKNTGLLTRIREGVVNAANIVKRTALNSLKAIGNFLGFTSLGTTVAEGAAETVITANKGSQLGFMGGLITAGLTRLGVAVATAAANIASVSALTLGIGTVVALAAAGAGIAWLYSKTKPKKTGDFMSKGQNIGESVTPGGLKGNEGLISVGGKTRTFDTNVDEVNISPNAVTGVTPKQIPVKTSAITQQVTSAQQDNSDIVKAIKALGEKPGMSQTKTDTLPASTDLFAENTKIGKGVYQRQNEGQLLFS